MVQRRTRRTALAAIAMLATTGLLTLPAAADLNLVAEDSAQVAYTEGDGVNVRDAADLAGGILTTLPEGYAVTIDSGPFMAADGTNWYAITTETEEGTISGWVLADYLTSAPEAESDVTIEAATSVASNVQVEVSADGDTLNLRADASLAADVLAEIPDRALLDVLAPAITDADGMAWTLVSYDGTVGYSASAYLATLGATAPDPDVLAATGVFTLGGTAAVAGTAGDGLILRGEPTVDADAMTTLADGGLVQVLDGPSVDANGDAWYQVDAAGTTGWMHGGYLTGIPSVLSDALLAGDESLGTATATGALAYLAVPYLDGGTGADGIDSAGLLSAVVSQSLDVAFPATLAEQSTSGEFVAQADLLPGDLLFFQGTGQPGLSNAGIYLGEGQFVSASPELGLVLIGHLDDPYWASGYLTGRRISADAAAQPAG